MKFDRSVNLLLTKSKSKSKVLKLGSNESAPKGYTGVAEYPNGVKVWYLNGKHHREDGPAVKYSDGSKYWWLNGQRHRADGPAVEYADGSKSWFLKGQHHREDGPAIEYSDGSKAWCLNDREVTEEEFNQRKTLRELGGADFDGILDI